VTAAVHVLLAAPVPDPFEFFRPSLTVSAGERGRLDQGEPLAGSLRGGERQITVFAAVRIHVDGDRLVAWMRSIAGLKRSAAVPAISRFSDPPRLEDLGALTLDEADLGDIRTCRPQDCGVKLADPEIAEFRQSIAGRQDWKPLLQDGFRRLLLRRVQAYLAEGSDGPGPSALPSILRELPFLHRVPGLIEYLERYPRAPMPAGESFLYWAKEQFGGKPVVRAIHVSIVRGGSDAGLPDALVIARQIYASHYMDGSLAVTALMRGVGGSPTYLVYVHRSEVDVFDRFFGGMVRRVVERRLRTDGAAALDGLRHRLESGPPDQ
jgi:hypothetical protein